MDGFFKDLWAVTIGKLFAVAAIIAVYNKSSWELLAGLMVAAVVIELIEKLINIIVDLAVPKRREAKPWAIDEKQVRVGGEGA